MNIFSQTFRSKPIEFLTSFCMIAIGLGMTIVSQSAGWSAAGAVLTTLGGVLISWSASAIQSTQQAAAILRPQLETTSRHLGTVSGQLGRIIEAVGENRVDPTIAFQLVLQANATLYGLVTDLQRLTGTQFDAQDLLSNIDRIQELGKRIGLAAKSELAETEDSDEPNVVNQLLGEVAELRSKIDAKHVVTSTEKLAAPSEKVECPACGAENYTIIATHSGASGFGVCKVCRSRFHTHRRPNGSVFSRQMGVSAFLGELGTSAFDDVSYARIIKDQGIRLVSDHIRAAILRSFVRILAESRVESMSALDSLVRSDLADRGYDVNESDITKCRHLIYRARLFDLSRDTGIGLVEGVTGDNVMEMIDRNIVGRIVQIFGIRTDVEELSRVLYVDHNSMRPTIEKYIREVQSGNEGTSSKRI